MQRLQDCCKYICLDIFAIWKSSFVTWRDYLFSLFLKDLSALPISKRNKNRKMEKETGRKRRNSKRNTKRNKKKKREEKEEKILAIGFCNKIVDLKEINPFPKPLPGGGARAIFLGKGDQPAPSKSPTSPSLSPALRHSSGPRHLPDPLAQTRSRYVTKKNDWKKETRGRNPIGIFAPRHLPRTSPAKSVLSARQAGHHVTRLWVAAAMNEVSRGSQMTPRRTMCVCKVQGCLMLNPRGSLSSTVKLLLVLYL